MLTIIKQLDIVGSFTYHFFFFKKALKPGSIYLKTLRGVKDFRLHSEVKVRVVISGYLPIVIDLCKRLPMWCGQLTFKYIFICI